MASIFAPVLYLIIVVGGLGIFSSLYRKRSARTLSRTSPRTRNATRTVTLIQQTSPPAPDALLKAALVRRAMADVQRVIRLREDKPALQMLLQKGSVGDDFWASLLAAEKEIEAEVLEVMHEANSFVHGWGQFIFNSAGEMVQNEKTKKLLDELPKVRAEAESKYNVKKKKSAIESAPAAAKVKRPTTPAPPSVSTPSISTPVRSQTPVDPTPSNGGLSPPIGGADGESVASMSDGELISAPSTPGKSSKKSGKKGKKRK
ncbi:Pre protein translocase subunit Sec66-domain-containing protein [Phellopilus nigrolimitatus]|nr:Pre protein translocase subunit Sec66-domain-containing protein [Phellopilus nigrolimitatus]